MKKVIFLALSAAMLAGAAVAAPQLNSADRTIATHSQRQKPARALRPIVPTRPTAAAKAIDGLTSAPERLRRKSLQVNGPRKAARATQLSADLKLRGSVVSTWSFMRFPGLYYIPTTADGSFEEVPGAAIIAEYGAWDDGNGLYYMAGVQDWGMGFVIPELYVYDSNTWEEADYLECEYSIIGTDNATDPTTGDVYGCYYDADFENLTWAKADYPAGLSNSIRTLDENERVFGVACDASGQYYAVIEGGVFVKVDKATGEFTKIGDTGLRPYYVSSAAFDDKSGKVIFSYAPETGNTSLWAINPADGAAELILEFEENDQITALEVIRPEAEPLAPAAPQFTAEVPDGGDVLNYTITMPTATFDGTPAEGALTWGLMVDGTEVATGESAYGQTVSGSYTLETKGAHSLMAYASNEVGRSPRVKLSLINGAGVPKAPQGLGINNFGGGSIGLYWDAVTEAADGAYVDPAGVTYSVSRNGQTVAEGLTDTWFDDQVEVPDTYMKLNYEVFAVFSGNVSEAAAVSTGIGAVQPPYADKFSQSDNDSELYTAINVMDDNGYWWFSPYYGCYIYDYCDQAADDWLISPAFALEAGKTYELSYDISGNSDMYTERYAVAMGVAPTAAAMVTELLPDTELKSNRDQIETVVLTLKPTSNGNYYIGWHALSDASQFQIHLRNIKLSAPMTAASPAAATELSLTPDAEGHLKLHGTFKAPATDISGNALTALGKVVVTRSGKDEAVAEFNAPAPGAALEFDDNDFAQRGTYTYYVNATNAAGDAGRECSASVYVGPIAPADVPEVKLVEGNVAGTAVLTWTAPETDIEGNRLNPANLSYMVYVAGDYGVANPVLEAPITEREARFTVCKPDEMAFATFYVEAINLGLESKGLTRSPMVPVGEAETLPYKHSFNDADRAAHLLGYVIPTDIYATVSVGNAENDGVAAADGDDAFLKINDSYEGTSVDVFTGKIDLGMAKNPALTLYTYKWSDADRNTFEAFATDSEGREVSLGLVEHTGMRVGWNFVMLSLDKVAGKTVKITLQPTFVSHEDQLFDAVAVADRYDIDLVATGLTAPLRVAPAKEFALTATVANAGVNPVAEYTVDLLLGGEVVASAKGDALQPGEQTAVNFVQTLSPLVEGTLEYTAKVNVAGDGNEADNLSAVAAPELVLSKFPAVSDLSAERTDGGVQLAWTTPSTAGFDVKEVEDFEDAKAWTEEVEGWTMVDRDGQQIGSLDGAGMPDAVARRTTHAFYVFDSESDDIFFYNPDLAYLVSGNSGSKSLVACYLLNPEADQDDWAISPLLSGEAQTLSFYARSFHPEYLDHMEVLYATEDTVDPDKFITLCPDGDFEVPQKLDAVGNAAYTLYEFDLPAGAKRFALRATNRGGEGFMLMIDDVKFRQANAELAIDSYDVYRDGEKVNAAPVAEPSYADLEADGKSHSYNVIVNYNRGISPKSNTVVVEPTGVDNVQAAAARVSVEQREIVVAGADGSQIRLYAVDGRELYRGVADCRIAVQPGSYVLTLGDTSLKVVVK